MPESDEKPAAPVPSPCVRNCCLDDQDICLGCGRTLEEILAWTSLDAAGQREVLQRAARRRQQRVSRDD